MTEPAPDAGMPPLWPLLRAALLELDHAHPQRAVPVKALVQRMSLPFVDGASQLGQALDWAQARGLVTHTPGFVTLTEAGAQPPPG